MASRRAAARSVALAPAVLLLAAGASGCGAIDGPPVFESVLELEDTFDPIGPYTLEAWVQSDLGARLVVARVTDDPLSELFGEVRLELVEGDAEHGRWQGELPGRPAPAQYAYYLVAVDPLTQSATWPEQAPDELWSFRVREAD